MDDSDSPHSSLKTSLVGLVAALTVVDAALLLVATTTSHTELLRLLLAIGVFGVPFLGFLLGIAHRPRYALGASLSLPVAALYGYTGLLLPWTQLSFALGGVGLELVLSVPIVGEPLASVFFGGVTLSQATPRIAFRSHYAIVAVSTVGVVAAVASAGWRRLGSESAGADRSG